MARTIITHMYRNNREDFNLIDRITGELRMHGFYRMTDSVGIYNKDGIEIGRYEVAEGFAPLVYVLSRLSNIRGKKWTAKINLTVDRDGKVRGS